MQGRRHCSIHGTNIRQVIKSIIKELIFDNRPKLSLACCIDKCIVNVLKASVLGSIYQYQIQWQHLTVALCCYGKVQHLGAEFETFELISVAPSRLASQTMQIVILLGIFWRNCIVFKRRTHTDWQRRKITLRRELQIAQKLAFLVEYTNDPYKVMVLCLEVHMLGAQQFGQPQHR